MAKKTFVFVLAIMVAITTLAQSSKSISVNYPIGSKVTVLAKVTVEQEKKINSLKTTWSQAKNTANGCNHNAVSGGNHGNPSSVATSVVGSSNALMIAQDHLDKAEKAYNDYVKSLIGNAAAKAAEAKAKK